MAPTDVAEVEGAKSGNDTVRGVVTGTAGFNITEELRSRMESNRRKAIERKKARKLGKEESGTKEARPPIWEWRRGVVGQQRAVGAEEGDVERNEEAREQFVPAAKFEGAKAGMVFKKGPTGLGYYEDQGSQQASQSQSHTHGAIKLNLSALITPPGEHTSMPRQTRARRPRKNRTRPRKRRAPMEAESFSGSVISTTGSPWANSDMCSSFDPAVSEISGFEIDSLAAGSDCGSAGGSLASNGEAASLPDSEVTEGTDRSGEDGMSEAEQEEAGGHRGWWVIDTVNANSWGGTEGASKGKGALDFLQRSMADVVMIQETRLADPGKRQAAHRAARRSKWNLLAPAAATTTKGYSSAGVALAARVGFGMAGSNAFDELEYDHTRIVGRHVGIMCRGGVCI